MRDVHAAGFGFDGAGRGLGDVAEDELVEVDFAAPPALVGGEAQMVAGRPLVKLERAGADGMIGVALGVRFHGGLADDGGKVERADIQKCGIRLGQRDDDGVIILRDAVFDVDGADDALAGLIGGVQAEGVQNVLRGEGRAVMEGNALAQLEAVVRVVDLLPFGGKTRKKVHIRVGRKKRVVDLMSDVARARVVGGIGQKALGLAADRDSQRVTVGGAAGRSGFRIAVRCSGLGVSGLGRLAGRCTCRQRQQHCKRQQKAS